MPMVAAAAAAVVGSIASAVGTAATAVALTLGASASLAVGIGTVAMAIVPTALGIGASLAFSALTAPPKVGVTAAGTQVDWQADPTAPVPYLIGRTGTAGTIVLRTVAGDHNKYLHTSTVLSGAGPVKSIGPFTADTSAVTFGADGGEGATGTYANRMWWKARLGAHDGQAQAWSATNSSHTPANNGGTPLPIAFGKMSGLAATLWALEYDAKTFPTGVPKPLQVVEGVTAYDPRLDSSRPGGAGDQRADNEASWTYSENPALHALTWCLGRRENGKATFGLGAPAEALDIAAFTEAANVADAHGWKVGGVVYSTDGKRDVLRALLEAGSARPIPLGAKISCVVDAPRVSLATLTGVDVVGDASIAAIKPARSAPNTVWPRYREEAQGWQVVPTAAPVAVTAYYENDGGPRSQEYEWKLVQSADQVATLARYRIENGREFGPITLPCKPRWMGYRPGDCITVDEPEYGLNGQKCLILGRQVDPASMVCTLTLQSETDGKHAFALSETADPPPLPGLTGVDTLTMPAPGVGSWAIADNKTINEAGVILPAIVVTGDVDNPRAEAVILDHKPVGAADDQWVSEEWPASATRLISTSVAAATSYEVAIRYRSILKVENPDEALDLGQVTTANTVSNDTKNVGGTSSTDILAKIAAALAGAAANLAAVQGIQALVDAGLANAHVEVLAAQATLQAALTATNAEVATTQSDLASANTTLQAAISATNAQVATTRADLAATQASLQGSIAATQTDLDSARTTLQTAVSAAQAEATLARTNAAANTVDLVNLTTTVGANATFASTSITTLVNSDTALGSRIDNLSATVGGNSSAISSEITARTTANTALGARVDSLTATVGSNATFASTSVTGLANADTALGSRIDTLSSTVGANATYASTSITALATADAALGARIDTLTTTVGVNSAAITAETDARTTADSALASQITTISAVLDVRANLVKNGSFGSGSASWTLSNDAAVGSSDHGTFLGKFLASGSAGNTYIELGTQLLGNIGPGAYALQADLYTGGIGSTNTYLEVFVFFFDATSTFLGQASIYVNATADWTIYKRDQLNGGVITAPANTAQAIVRIDLMSYSGPIIGAGAPVAATRIKLERNTVCTAYTEDGAGAAASAQISAEAVARTNADGALGLRIDSVSATVGANASFASTSITALANADSAQVARVDTLTATVGANATFASTSITGLATADTALGSRIDSLTTTVGANSTAITSETTSRTNADQALGSRVDTLTATVGTNAAFASTSITALATADTALGGRIDTLNTTVGANSTAISSETTARASADTAMGGRVDTLTATVADSAASITAEVTARSTADSALGSRVDAISTTVAGNTASISSEIVSRTGADSALSGRIDTLSSTVGANAASASSTLTALALADSALGGRIDAITVTTGQNTAAISNETTARTNAVSSLASQITTLNTTYNGVRADLTSESTTRADADSALGGRIDTLRSDYNGTAATVTTQASTLAQLGQLYGSYGLRVTAGQVVTGITLYAASGAVNYSGIHFEADQFALTKAGSTIIPFLFDTNTGTAYLQNVAIAGDLLVAGTITNSKVQQGAITRTGYAESGVARYVTNTQVNLVSVGLTTLGGVIEITSTVAVTVGNTSQNDHYIRLVLVRSDGNSLNLPFLVRARTDQQIDFSSGSGGGGQSQIAQVTVPNRFTNTLSHTRQDHPYAAGWTYTVALQVDAGLDVDVTFASIAIKSLEA